MTFLSLSSVHDAWRGELKGWWPDAPEGFVACRRVSWNGETVSLGVEGRNNTTKKAGEGENKKSMARRHRKVSGTMQCRSNDGRRGTTGTRHDLDARTV